MGDPLLVSKRFKCVTISETTHKLLINISTLSHPVWQAGHLDNDHSCRFFCAGAQRSKLVFANGLPITLGMNEATSPNTTRVTLATATRGTGIKMAIYCPQGRDFHTRAQRKMVTKWSSWSHQLVMG